MHLQTRWVNETTDLLSAADVMSELGYGDTCCDEDPALFHRLETRLIPAAIEWAETYLRRAIVDQDIVAEYADASGSYPILRPHLLSIDKIEKITDCGEKCDVTDYRVDSHRTTRPTIVFPASNCSPICMCCHPFRVRVRYRAGWDGPFPPRLMLGLTWMVRALFDGAKPQLMDVARKTLDQYRITLPPGTEFTAVRLEQC